MTRTKSFQLGAAAGNNKVKLLLIAALIPVLAVSFYAFQPHEEYSAYDVAPIATPTPRQVKSVAVGDVNGDGMPHRSKGKGRFKGPGSNGTSAGRKAVRRTSTKTVSGQANSIIARKKNQDVEVENDETHWVGNDRKVKSAGNKNSSFRNRKKRI